MTWRSVTIGELGKVVTGKTPKSSSPDEFGTDFPFITPSDMLFSVRNIYTERFLSNKGKEALSKASLPKKSICVVCIGATIGKVCLTRSESYSNQQINSIIPNRQKHHPDFIYYLATLLRDTLESFAGGAATPIVNKSVFSAIKILVPDLQTQKKIAAILSAYDDLIENNKRRIALLENMAEEIYREWFVRFRFPNYKNAEFEKGIPKGWELVTLDKAFKCLGGGTPSKESNAYWKEGDINWYTPSDITGAEGFFLSSSKDKCNEEGLARSSAKMFPAYSIMMTSRATIGAIGINTTPACTNQGFITCIPNKKYPLTYLYYWFKLSKSHFVMLSGGATFPELSKTTFKRIEILTPSHEIIDEFDKIVKPIFEQVEKLLAMNESLKQSKNSLLPRLISGKLTVENLNIQFPPSMEM